MEIVFFAGEEIYEELTDNQFTINFKEIFQLSLSKFTSAMEFLCLSDDNTEAPLLTTYFEIKLGGKFKIDYYDSIFHEKEEILHRIHLSFYYNNMETQNNKVDFASPVVIQLRPDII